MHLWMSGMKKRLRRSATLAMSGIALAALLGGCAMSDDKLARFLVSPDKYVLYSCEEIAAEAQRTAARQQELQQLMARAGTDSAGRLVSATAYRPDYVAAQGDMNELRAAAASKHCNFVPGESAPAATSNAR